MFIRPISDLHIDGCKMLVPMTKNEHETVLVLAGDVCELERKSQFMDFFKHINNRFKAIIYVPGNHEYYRGSFSAAKRKFTEAVEELNLNNFYLLDRDYIAIEDVVFIGATLWTDMNSGDPWAIRAAHDMMNDYRFIRIGASDTDNEAYARKLRPIDTISKHKLDRKYIFEAIKIHKANGKKVVVVTHHAPSTMSIHEKYLGDATNWAYASRLENEILDTQPQLWIHGHMHTSFDYEIDQTRVICNPRGYTKVINIKLLHDMEDDLRMGVDSAVQYNEVFRCENKEFDVNLLIDTHDL